MPSTDEYDGQKLFTKRTGVRLATPLFAVLILVETTDVIFAVDSIPAILSVSHQTFIVFSSNAFAILGLRSLYFLLAGMQGKFRYLNVGLGAILAFVGVKMLLLDVWHMPTSAEPSGSSRRSSTVTILALALGRTRSIPSPCKPTDEAAIERRRSTGTRSIPSTTCRPTTDVVAGPRAVRPRRVEAARRAIRFARRTANGSHCDPAQLRGKGVLDARGGLHELDR